jgi:hypothetical protein
VNLIINRIVDLLHPQITYQVASDLRNSLYTILTPMIINQLSESVDQAMEDFEQEEVQ